VPKADLPLRPDYDGCWYYPRLERCPHLGRVLHLKDGEVGRREVLQHGISQRLGRQCQSTDASRIGKSCQVHPPSALRGARGAIRTEQKHQQNVRAAIPEKQCVALERIHRSEGAYGTASCGLRTLDRCGGGWGTLPSRPEYPNREEEQAEREDVQRASGSGSETTKLPSWHESAPIDGQPAVSIMTIVATAAEGAPCVIIKRLAPRRVRCVMSIPGGAKGPSEPGASHSSDRLCSTIWLATA